MALDRGLRKPFSRLGMISRHPLALGVHIAQVILRFGFTWFSK